MNTKPLDPKVYEEAQKRYEKMLEERNRNIVALKESGWTFERIGRHYNISKQAVEQIYKRLTKK